MTEFDSLFKRIGSDSDRLSFMSLFAVNDLYRETIRQAMQAQEDSLITLDAFNRLTSISQETWSSIASLFNKISSVMVHEQHRVHVQYRQRQLARRRRKRR